MEMYDVCGPVYYMCTFEDHEKYTPSADPESRPVVFLDDGPN